MDDLTFLNSLPANPPASIPASSLPTLPLDHPLYSTLAPLLATINQASGDETLDDESVEALLQQMEDSNTAIDGLDSRLDELLSTLDGLLGSLGGSTASTEKKTEADEAELEKLSIDEKTEK